MLHKVLFVVLLFISGISQSQNYYFENYNVEKGLPNSKVYDILQDNDGYIWLATPSGLSRFDGENFKIYGLDDNISESTANALFLDSKNHLWIGFENGDLYVKNDKDFHLIINDSINPKNNIFDITEDNRGDIIATSFGGGVFIVKHPLEPQQTIKHFTAEDHLLDESVIRCKTFSDGRVFFTTGTDLMYMDADTTVFHRFYPKDFPTFFLTSCFLEDSKGNIWIGKYNGGLYKYNPQTGEYLFFDMRDGLAKNFVSTIHEDANGQIWVGTFGGGLSLIENDKIKINFNNSNGISGLKIHHIIEDKEGNILIATQENGFQIFKGNQFLTLTENSGLPNHQIWDICKLNDSTILLGTNNGIAKVKLDSNLKADVESVYNMANTDLVSNNISTLKRDNDGNVWVGTALSGIQKYDIRTNKFIYNSFLNSNLPRYVKKINDIEVLDDELYIATVEGLVHHEISKGRTQTLTQIKGLSGNDISSLYLGQNNKLWIGIRDNGINYIENHTITALQKTSDITPNCFTENSKGDLFIGTLKGVYQLMGDSITKVLDIKNGLLSNYVSIIYFIDDNRLLIGSNNGLNIYNFSEHKITNYNKELGFTGIESKRGAFAKYNDNALLIGTTGGLMIYNTAAKEKKTIEPFVHITNIKVNMKNKEMIPHEHFHYSDNSFLFNYHAISLNNQANLTYQVMLEGLDQNWREPTQSQNISFSKLSPGDYTFKVKSRTFDGIENENPASYNFTIKPPFWLTWWFISSSLFIIIVTVFSAVRYRIYKLQKEKKVLEQKVADRTKEISQKNELLAERNKHITDSINYARRIQHATMRPESQLKDLYDKAFIIYLPKDIVSGDFYWFAKKGDKLIVAAADCTGHGVPGAFMSMLGIAFLNEIVGRMTQITAGDILQKLRANVIKALHQTDETDTAKDGMDIALVVLDVKKQKVQFSGAYNPLYIIREGELMEQKGDRMPIGVHVRDKETFTNHIIDLEKDDQLYFFTDGFADQFGGPKGKKMNYKRFRKLIIDQYMLNEEQQQENLLKAFHDWKGTQEQLDDVLLIGLKV